MSKSIYTLVTIILYMQNILYIYYRYIVKSVYGDIVISVQYIRIYTMHACTYIISTSLYTLYSLLTRQTSV
jgi:hypothetical protein